MPDAKLALFDWSVRDEDEGIEITRHFRLQDGRTGIPGVQRHSVWIRRERAVGMREILVDDMVHELVCEVENLLCAVDRDEVAQISHVVDHLDRMAVEVPHMVDFPTDPA